MTHTFLDVRPIALHKRHVKIFSLFEELDNGDYINLVNDHDPAPLRRQFQDLGLPFQWEYLREGPQEWEVRITKGNSKERKGHSDGGCCGFCGG